MHFDFFRLKLSFILRTVKILSRKREREPRACVSRPPGALVWEDVPRSSSLRQCFFFTWCLNNQDNDFKVSFNGMDSGNHALHI